MNLYSASSHAQKRPDLPLPLKNPPPVVEVVDCVIERSSGCFSADSTTHHQRGAAHIAALTDWAVGQGMYSRDAQELAAREPLKFDEAVHEILNMDAARLDGLHNLGGWIVWFVGKKATGRRRWVDERPVNRRTGGRY